MFHVHTMPVGPFQCNCSILACDQTREAVIIDPGGEDTRIIAHVNEAGYKVKWILHTHAHLDHFGATAPVQAAVGGKVCLHKDDMFLYQGAAMQAAMLGLPPIQPPPVDKHIEDEETYAFGKMETTAIFTPGHTPGSASFLFTSGDQQILFSGDTLFHRSIGRTDLPGGDSHLIVKSIRTRLFALDGDTQVIPGHGQATRIGDEMRQNPFVGV